MQLLCPVLKGSGKFVQCATDIKAFAAANAGHCGANLHENCECEGAVGE